MIVRLSRAVLAVLAVTVAVLISGTALASAHVSVSSDDAARGGFGEVTFRVPTESDTASTISLRVQLPTDKPIANVSVKPVPGWTVATTTTPLNPPVTDDDGNQVTEAVSEITWTAAPGAGIKPGEYQTFSISAGPLPDTGSLTLPTIQGYDDGTEVSWVDPTVDGQAEPEHPAPVLTLLSGDGTASDTASSATPADSGTSGVAVTALILAILGLLAGLGALFVALASRRRPSA